MKEIDKKKISNNNQTKRPGRTDRRDHKLHQANVSKNLKAKETRSKASSPTAQSSISVSDSNAGTEPSEVYKNMVIHYVDDANRFEATPQDLKANAMIAKENKDDVLDNHSTDLETESSMGKEEVSDSETIKDSVSSQGDLLTADDDKVERPSSVKNNSSEDCQRNIPQSKAIHNTPKKSIGSIKGPSRVVARSSSKADSQNMKFPSKLSSESSEGVDDKSVKEVKEVDELDGTSNGAQSFGSDDETIDAEESDEHKDEAALEQKIEEMETRIEKLEEELREVAALEISLYSVVPEHGSSAHKVHTPARRLSRIYIHACKHWTLDKRATIAKNTVSGLVLIAKSCGNDVPRYIFLVIRVL